MLISGSYISFEWVNETWGYECVNLTWFQFQFYSYTSICRINGIWCHESYWVIMLKKILHGFPMLCGADIFGHTFIFLSCCTLQRVDELFRINELIIWELVKCDSISNYRKYFAFSSSQYAYNIARLFLSSFLLSQSPPSPWKTLPRIQTQPINNHPLFSNRKFPLALNGKDRS